MKNSWFRHDSDDFRVYAGFMRSSTLSAPLTLLAAAVLALPGCSIHQLAVDRLGDALAKTGTTFTADDDPELVGQALPFGLKLMESILAESPSHRGLLLATASGFTAYSNLWVAQPADELRELDFEAADRQYERARRLYLRARDYGLRGLEVRHPGIGAQLEQDPALALRSVRQEDVPYLVWTAAPWALAISLSVDQPEMIVQLPIVEALFYRAFELDPSFDSGLLHSLLLSYEAARPLAGSTGKERAREHFRQAVSLSAGALAAPFVSLAESVALPEGDRAEFEQLLGDALAVDIDVRPGWRLQNVISQRRARWLLGRIDDLFLEPDQESYEDEDEPYGDTVSDDISFDASRDLTIPSGEEL
jgi:predicted anti-sigma-YlaC factor YlaD